MTNILPKHLLNKNVLDEIIKRRSSEGATLSITHILDEDFSRWQLKDAASKFYGGWTQARRENGASTHKGSYSGYPKKYVVDELNRLQSNGHSMKIKDFEQDLVYAIQEHFGGYTEAKLVLGIETSMNMTDKRMRRDLAARKFTNDELIFKVRRASSSSCDLNFLYVNHRDLVNIVYKRKYTLRGFAEEHGIELPKSKIVSRGASKFTKAGLTFEHMLGEILDDLGVSYTKNAHERWNPDFVINDNVWLDAKLSYWTRYHRMLERYTPHCDRLLVVYLRGPNIDEYIGGEYPHRKMSVYKLTEKLNETKRMYYEGKLMEIETELKAA